MLLLCLFDIIKHVVLPWNVPLFCCCIVYIELLNSEPLELYILTSSVPVWNLRGVLEVLVPSAYAVAGLHAFCKAPLRTNIKLLSGKNSFTKSQITTKMHPVHNVSIKYIYKHRQKKEASPLAEVRIKINIAGKQFPCEQPTYSWTLQCPM